LTLDPSGGGGLRATGLSKTYQFENVVRNVSLVLVPGEAVALLGPNGAGKTTLMSMMIGVISADDGTVEIDSEDVTRQPIYERAARGLSYLPQDASVFRGLSVEDNIMLYLEAREPARDRRLMRLENLLAEFELTDIRKQKAGRLSGGQRRRCEIARSLANEPRYLLLDEPFAGVDPLAITELKQTIRRLTTRGIGVLISDHNVRETLSIADRGYIMFSGTVLAQGSPQALVQDANVRRHYLGSSLDI
jgi:lipopolysaccharide export system ATP-binding protein